MFSSEYKVGHQEKLTPLRDVPKMDAGAPCPRILSNGYELKLAYYLPLKHPTWDGTNPMSVDPSTTQGRVAVVVFRAVQGYADGPPNDEGLGNHPFWKIGLRPYEAYEVSDSTRVNEGNGRHFIFTFHDSTFECVAKGYASTVLEGTVDSAID